MVRLLMLNISGRLRLRCNKAINNGHIKLDVFVFLNYCLHYLASGGALGIKEY